MLKQLNSAIDTFQSYKTAFVDTCVPTAAMKKPMYSFIDAQTKFAKAVVSEVTEFYKTVNTATASVDISKMFKV